ncbi:hypothetical protein GE061_017218 [Apolygus lucorum]|uniref:Uncharacterized protein n=1 Tax=Apolygus lucorum TaxID=248454 RepID=A0A8S9XBT5_APOLU|nr:hypothetical protein GE061_017218 [Apolygus lucorum]
MFWKKRPNVVNLLTYIGNFANLYLEVAEKVMSVCEQSLPDKPEDWDLMRKPLRDTKQELHNMGRKPIGQLFLEYKPAANVKISKKDLEVWQRMNEFGYQLAKAGDLLNKSSTNELPLMHYNDRESLKPLAEQKEDFLKANVLLNYLQRMIYTVEKTIDFLPLYLIKHSFIDLETEKGEKAIKPAKEIIARLGDYHQAFTMALWNAIHVIKPMEFKKGNLPVYELLKNIGMPLSQLSVEMEFLINGSRDSKFTFRSPSEYRKKVEYVENDFDFYLSPLGTMFLVSGSPRKPGSIIDHDSHSTMKLLWVAVVLTTFIKEHDFYDLVPDYLGDFVKQRNVFPDKPVEFEQMRSIFGGTEELMYYPGDLAFEGIIHRPIKDRNAKISKEEVDIWKRIDEKYKETNEAQEDFTIKSRHYKLPLFNVTRHTSESTSIRTSEDYKNMRIFLNYMLQVLEEISFNHQILITYLKKIFGTALDTEDGKRAYSNFDEWLSGLRMEAYMFNVFRKEYLEEFRRGRIDHMVFKKGSSLPYEALKTFVVRLMLLNNEMVKLTPGSLLGYSQHNENYSETTLGCCSNRLFRRSD